MRLTLYIVVIFALFTCFSCHNNPTGPSQPELAISADYVGVTDAALRLHIIYMLSTDKFQLREDTALIASGRIPLTDTVIYVDNLLPYRSYYFYLAKLDSAGAVEGGTTLTFTTMDTTSNNFTWHFDTLAGQGGSSVFSDVVILDDTTAYAVGDLFFADTVVGQQTPNERNFAIWNGKQWTLQLVRYLYPNGIASGGPLYSIFAFNRNDIWVGGGEAFHWDGDSWIQTGITTANFGGRLYRFWGNSSSDLYVVGTNGSMAHYDGHQWTKIQTGTSLDIQDIWGATDPRTGQQTILAVAAQPLESYDKMILNINGNTVTPVSDSGINWPLSSVWFLPNRHYYVVGSGIYEKHSLNDATWKNGPLDITQYYTYSIRGVDLNDVATVGGYGEVLHFNGAKWNSFHDQTGIDGNYNAVALKGDILIAVGVLNPPAIVAVGQHR
jgi:hypothetical protein